MNEMKAWWGHVDGKERIVVASSATKAADLVKVSRQMFPYRFEKTSPPLRAEKSGVYYPDGGGGGWERVP